MSDSSTLFYTIAMVGNDGRREGGLCTKVAFAWPNETPDEHIARQLLEADPTIYAFVNRNGRVFNIDTGTYRDGPADPPEKWLTYYDKKVGNGFRTEATIEPVILTLNK